MIRELALECRAMKKVRDEMRLRNVKLMIPFCRTVEEGRKLIAELKQNGLVQGEYGIDRISVTPDVALKTKLIIAEAKASAHA